MLLLWSVSLTRHLDINERGMCRQHTREGRQEGTQESCTLYTQIATIDIEFFNKKVFHFRTIVITLPPIPKHDSKTQNTTCPSLSTPVRKGSKEADTRKYTRHSTQQHPLPIPHIPTPYSHPPPLSIHPPTVLASNFPCWFKPCTLHCASGVVWRGDGDDEVPRFSSTKVCAVVVVTRSRVSRQRVFVCWVWILHLVCRCWAY